MRHISRVPLDKHRAPPGHIRLLPGACGFRVEGLGLRLQFEDLRGLGFWDVGV